VLAGQRKERKENTYIDALMRNAGGRGCIFLLRVEQQRHELVDRRQWDVATVVAGKQGLALEVEEEDSRRHRRLEGTDAFGGCRHVRWLMARSRPAVFEIPPSTARSPRRALSSFGRFPWHRTPRPPCFADLYRFVVAGYSPPLGYRTPPWPSLYWPFDPAPNTPQYLYYGVGKHHPSAHPLTKDIWRFTLYWTFVIFGGVFFVAGMWAWSVYPFKTKWAILIPFVYVVSGIFIALISGTIVGTVH